MTPWRPRSPDVVSCSASGCSSQGLAVHQLDGDGRPILGAPWGWGEVDVTATDGGAVTLYVCSPRCERRLASGLVASKFRPDAE